MVFTRLTRNHFLKNYKFSALIAENAFTFRNLGVRMITILTVIILDYHISLTVSLLVRGSRRWMTVAGASCEKKSTGKAERKKDVSLDNLQKKGAKK